MKNQLLRILRMSGKFSIYILVLKSFLFSSILASDLKAQYKSVHEVVIDVNFRQATIKQVLNHIEKETDYLFQYYNGDIPDGVRLSMHSGEISVADVLYNVSSQSNLKFRQVNNSIAVAKRKKNQPSEYVQVVEEVTVSGKVVDENNEPFPGVTVLVKGTTTGTVTDIDGNYSLTVEEDAVLVFSFIGFETQEISVTGRTVIDVSLAPDITTLDEVVVVGYGETERKKLTESISIVDAELIESFPAPSFDYIMQGAATGVQVAPVGGQPGGGVAIRIRGISSLTSSNSPLYVVDGVPINGGNLTDDALTGNGLANINPSDIETISILKDASATSIYGSRGTNGVVLITTKKGKPGKSKIRFSTQHGFTDFENPNNFEVMNNQEYIEYHREAAINAGGNPDDPSSSVYFPLGDTINTVWTDHALQTGIIKRYDLSVSGGSDKTRYFSSVGYYDEEGIVRKTDFRRFSTRFNLDHEINEKASVGINISISDARQTNRQGGGTSFRDPIYGSFFLSPLYPIFANEEQITAGEDAGTGYNFNTPGFAGHNIVASQELNTNLVRTFRTIGNIYASFEVIPNLTLRTSFGVDRVDLQEDEFLSPRYETARTEGEETLGNVLASTIREVDLNLTNTASYSRDLGGGHSMEVLVGNELIESVSEQLRAEKEGFATDKLPTINSATTAVNDGVDTDWTSWRMASFFAKVNYTYNDKYLLNLFGRTDGSSRFGPDTRWGNFWGVGAGYVISEEDFMDGIDFVDFLKLRVGLGTQGNHNIGNFSWLTSYSFNRNTNLNGINLPGSRPSNLGDVGVTWERQFTVDVGIDVSLFNRLSLGVGYYRRNITDMLDEVPLSRTTGFNDITTNSGEMRNSGIEVEINSTNLRLGNFTWTSSLQFSKNKNEIIDIENGERVNTGDQEIQRVGESANSWYMAEWAGVDPATGRPLWFDEEGGLTSDFNNAATVIVGQQLPEFFGSFGNNFSYKGLTLSTSFYFNYGNDVYREVQRFLSADGARFGRNQSRDQLSRWQKPGDITDVPRIAQANGDGGNNHSSRYIEDGSFIKLRNVTLAYNLPQSLTSKLKVGNIRVYAQGVNLRTWTNFRGLDPETGLGSRDFGEYPNSRRVMFGIDVEF